MPVFLLDETLLFPPPELAREDGLLAVGGDLTPERLLASYEQGIFPWFSPGEPILWWAPSPRFVLFPAEFKVPRRLARSMRHAPFEVTADLAFRQVMTACGATRLEEGGETWIDHRMLAAYCALHDQGWAHSIECWQNGELAGGLYGVALGGTFYGESMFSRKSGSSKIALVRLVELLRRWDFDLIDCQVPTEHLRGFGARLIEGRQFQVLLAASVRRPTRRGSWAEEILQT